MNRDDDFGGLLNAAMAKRGIDGHASVDFLGVEGTEPNEVVLSFKRSDGKNCSVSVGSRLVPHRSAEQLANLAADRMAEAYAHASLAEAGVT